MGRLEKLICIMLSYYANIAAAYENRTDLIKNISMAMSSYFHTNCFIILQKMNSTPKYFETFKALSADAKISVGAYTFDDLRDWRLCSKQMNVIIGEELKEEFAAVSTVKHRRNSV